MGDLLPFTAAGKTLYSHQEEAIRLLRISLGLGRRRVVVQAPTGAGKTIIAAHLVKGALMKGQRVLFIAPAISLIDQTVAAFEAEGIASIGVMQANHPRTNPAAPVQIASVQTLARRRFLPPRLVIVDECHVRSDFVDRLMVDFPNIYFVGLSATPWAKGMGLRWEDLVIPCTIGELIDSGFLSRFTVFAPYLPDLREISIRAGDYAADALAKFMGDAKIVGSVVTTWLEKAENRPTLCFAVNRAHAQQLADEFGRHGVAAGYVDAFTDRVDRLRLFRQFERGEIRVICSVRTMTTGVDLAVSCIIDAAPTRSEILHIQKIGRGLRKRPGTEDCIILDHAGNSIRLGFVTDIHHAELDRSAPGEKQHSKPRNPERLPVPCPKCTAVFSGPVCVNCGTTRKPPRTEVVEGELVQLHGTPASPSKTEKQQFWSMCLWIDQKRGKNGRMAKALYREKFGNWPKGLRDVLAEPDTPFLNYEKSRRIAFGKRRAKEGA